MDIIEPNDALCQILDYIVANGVDTIVISATLEQRVKMFGNLLVEPLSDAPAFSLVNVCLPNLVTAKIHDVIKYEFDVCRLNID